MAPALTHHLKLAAVALAALALLTGCGFDASNFPWPDYIVGMINFAIFAGIIIKFGGPYIQQYFADRREVFLREMNAAQDARREAEARLEEYNQKLEALEQERQGLLDEYHAQGEREKQRIIEAAKQQVEKSRVDAQATIDMEVKKAVALLERQAVDLAVGMAEKRARAALTDDLQDQLFDRYVSELDKHEPSVH